MSRFDRYSRISALELCLERERRAWRSGMALFLLLLGGAGAALYSPAPERGLVGQDCCDFTGVLVMEQRSIPPSPAEAVARVLPPAPVADVVPRVDVVATEPPSFPPLALEWEALEFEPAEPLLVPDLPEVLLPASHAAPRSRGATPQASHRAEASSAATHSAVQGELVAASYRSTPRPPYPPSLLQRRVQGRVGLRIAVDAEGVPQSVEVCSSSGYAAFDRCAREWVLAHWRFYPARQGGKAVASMVRTQVEFVLR